jgi:hypothetical protein
MDIHIAPLPVLSLPLPAFHVAFIPLDECTWLAGFFKLDDADETGIAEEELRLHKASTSYTAFCALIRVVDPQQDRIPPRCAL